MALVVSALFALTGCDALLDLGPTASLLDATAEGAPPQDATSDGNAPQEAAPDSPVAEAGEAGPPEGGYPCGLPPQGNVMCDTCDVESCCAIDLSCSRNARCAEGVAKLQNCIYNANCVDQIDNDYADTGVLALQQCTVNTCIEQCFPGPLCSQLATCCPDIPSTSPSALQVCISSVNKLDETGCQNILDGILRPQFGSQFCAGIAPGDAGGD